MSFRNLRFLHFACALSFGVITQAAQALQLPIALGDSVDVVSGNAKSYQAYPGDAELFATNVTSFPFTFQGTLDTSAVAITNATLSGLPISQSTSASITSEYSVTATIDPPGFDPIFNRLLHISYQFEFDATASAVMLPVLIPIDPYTLMAAFPIMTLDVTSGTASVFIDGVLYQAVPLSHGQLVTSLSLNFTDTPGPGLLSSSLSGGKASAGPLMPLQSIVQGLNLGGQLVGLATDAPFPTTNYVFGIVTPIPEPSGVLLLMSGLLGLGATRRRRA